MIEDAINREVKRITSGNDKAEVEARKRRPLKKIDGFVENAKISPFRTFKKYFIEEDLPEVKKNLIEQVVVPRLKELACDIISGGAERIFLGQDRATRPASNGVRLINSLVRNANQITNYSTSSLNTTNTATSTTKHTFEDIVLVDRAAAQDLLDTLREAIAYNGNVSIAELYDALEVPDLGQWTDNDFGWKNLNNVQIVRVSSGYWLKLPKPEPLRQ